MAATTQTSMNFQLITQQYLASMIDRHRQAKNVLSASATYTEPFKGQPVNYPATITTEEELRRHLIRMGAGGDGAYAHLIMAAAKYPEFAVVFPKDDVANQSQRLAEDNRESSAAKPSNANITKSAPLFQKSYRDDPYEYESRRYFPLPYLKSAFGKSYSGINKKVSEIFKKIRSVSRLRLGVIRGKKTYEGQDSEDSYRVRRQGVQYQQPNDPSPSLEKILAAQTKRF